MQNKFSKSFIDFQRQKATSATKSIRISTDYSQYDLEMKIENITNIEFWESKLKNI